MPANLMETPNKSVRADPVEGERREAEFLQRGGLSREIACGRMGVVRKPK